MRLRTHRFPVVTIGIVVALACDRKTQSSSSPPSTATPSAEESAPTAVRQTSTISPTHFNGRDRAPGDIAREVVEHQLRGTALDSVHCLSPRTVTCGSLDVVRDYAPDSAIVRGDTASILVRYRVIGRLEQQDSTLRFVQASGDSSGRLVVDTVVIVRDSTGWLLARDVKENRIAAVLVALYFELPHDDSQRLISSAAIDEEVLRRPRLVDPRSISIMPEAMRDTLSRRGCRVPQASDDITANVIHGSFFGADSEDWAVFCAFGDAGKILVFRAGSGSPAATLALYAVAVPRIDRLPDPFAMPNERFGCVGAITTMSGAEARPLLDYADGDDHMKVHLTSQERAVVTHDAIRDGDCEGLSNSHYWTGRRWVRLPGDDD